LNPLAVVAFLAIVIVARVAVTNGSNLRHHPKSALTLIVMLRPASMFTFDYGTVTGAHLARTGINGFLNCVSLKVVFCPRVYHLDLIRQGALDGVPDGYVLYNDLSEGGAKWGRRDAGYADIYAWTAARNWVHFITDDTARDIKSIHFTTISDDQDKVAKAFAREWGSEATICRHSDKRAIDALLQGAAQGS
jgi:hypothetical protein